MPNDTPMYPTLAHNGITDVFSLVKSAINHGLIKPPPPPETETFVRAPRNKLAKLGLKQNRKAARD